MKKFLAWVLMLSMVLGLLCGCSDTDSSSDRRSNRKNRDKDQEIEDRVDDDDEDKKDNLKVTIEETVVYDENDIKVTVTGLKSTYSGQEFKVKVENNSDKNIAVSGDVFVVNGIMVDGWLYVEAAAGKKANGTLTFFNDSMETAGIEELAVVVATDARVVDTDSYDTLFEMPFTLETSIADEYVQAIDDSGDVIFESEGVTVIAKTVNTDGDLGTTVVLLVKNETGKNIIIESDNVSVNGYTIDAWMYDLLMADTVRFCELIIWSSVLEENEIDEVEEVAFTLSVRYDDSWDTLCESDELTVSVK